MKYVILCLVLMATGANAQRSSPIFSTRKDSIDFVALEAKLQKRFDAVHEKVNKRAQVTIDSINAARQQFLDDHKYVMRTKYTQNRNFTPYQLLPTIANKDSIEKISIVGNGRRASLPDSIFMYRNLSDLELIDFRISRLPKDLARLPVKRLTILNNFPKKKLRLPKNSTITTLTIRGDEQGKLPKSYRRMKNLEVLELSKNNLTKMPVVKNNDKLTRYELTFNSITVIPSWIGKLKSLKNLNLNNNKVELIKPGIERLKNLEELQLYRNNLKALPPMLYSMASLKVIDLYYNHIYSVTRDIANWKNLEVLYLSNNDLVSIPGEINQLTNLKELYIHHNKLTTIPSLSNLTSLYTLRINDNLLTELPAGIEQMNDLRYFDCAFNPWSSAAKYQILKLAIELQKNDAFVKTDYDVN